jgi:hypothetical protein
MLPENIRAKTISAATADATRDDGETPEGADEQG